MWTPSTAAFPGGSKSKESTCNAGDTGSIRELGRSPGRRKWQSTPAFLPGKSHGQRSLVGYSSWGCKESDTTGQLTFYFKHHWWVEAPDIHCEVRLRMWTPQEEFLHILRPHPFQSFEFLRWSPGNSPTSGLGSGNFCSNGESSHLDTPLLEIQNTKKLYGAKNNCAHIQLGQILDQKIQKRQKEPIAISEELGPKPKVWQNRVPLRIGCLTR